MKGSEVICSWRRMRDEEKNVGEGHKMEGGGVPKHVKKVLL